MPERDNAHLLQSVARRLAETADRNQVIEELCMAQNLDWTTAEETIDQAWHEYSPGITRRQSPILVLVAFSIYAGGVGLAAWQLLGLVAVISAFIKPQSNSFWDIYNLTFGFFNTLTNLPGLLFSFVAGLAMVLGSYYGMKDVLAAWLDAAQQGKTMLKGDFPALNKTPPILPGQQPEMAYSSSGWVRNRPDDTKLVSFILDLLEKSESKDWVINSVALSRGLSWQAAHHLVEEVARAHGFVFKDEIAYGPPVILGSLGIFLAGLVITFQYLVLAGIVLAPTFTKIDNSWTFLLFMRAVGDYIQMAPGAFALFALGLVMFIGGMFVLRIVAPSVYRWQPGSTP